MAETISPRVQVGFDPLWVETHYDPLFEEHLSYFYFPLLRTHLAWVVTLLEKEIIPRASAVKLCRALLELEKKDPEFLRPFVPEHADVYVHVEKYLEQQIGSEHVGHLALARTRPEPIARMVLREKLLRLGEAVLDLRQKLLEKAGENLDTVMTGYTHSQPAQATTLGHYLLAVHDPIAEDYRFLEDIYDNVNRCTMGSGALAGTSFPIDRYRVAELLGFDGIIENTYACVSSNDFLINSANSVVDIMVTLSRCIQDFNEWATFEVAMVNTAPQFSSYSSLMPQKYNTTVLEGGRVKTGYCISLAQNVANFMMKGHYADGKELDLCWNIAFKALDYARDNIRLLGEVIRTLQINEKRMLNLARENFCTVSELSDEIYRQKGLAYRTAHAIVGHVVNAATGKGLLATEITSSMVDEAACKVIGEPLRLSEESVRESLDPVSFVRRRTLAGGPAPQETARMHAEGKKKLARDRRTLQKRHENLSRADQGLDRAVRDILKEN